MRRPTVLTAVRASLALVVAGTFVNGTPGEGTTPAAAQTSPSTSPTLAGLKGQAGASGVQIVYAPEGLLPITPLAEIGAPDALATIASGPSTSARASVADPGDILANPDAVLTLADPNWPQGTIAPYPYRVTATSGAGAPRSESNPAPGLHARVEATAAGSEAVATMPAADAPAIATFGTTESSARTTIDGGSVSVTARTVVTDLNVLGLLTIDTILTTVTATSDGTDTKLEGGTTVSGASLLGQPVTIDADGIHAGDPSAPPDGVLGPLLEAVGGGLDEVLAAAGLHVSLPGPVEQDGGTSGRLGSSGVRIDLDFSRDTVPALGQLLASVPPLENPVPGAPGIEDVLAAAQAHHVMSIEFARASVSLTARATPPRAPLTTSTGGRLATPLPAARAGSLVGAPLTPRPASGPGAGAPAAVAVPAGSEQPATTLATGVGALAALALLAQPFVGSRIARLPAALLAADNAAACPRERP